MDIDPLLGKASKLPTQCDTIVIGAGLSGLATAWNLQRNGQQVCVLEAGERVGGNVRTLRREGYLVEAGPNTLQVNDPEIERCLRDFDLWDTAIEANPQANKRYIVRSGKPCAVPQSPWSAIRSPLFSLPAKLRLLREPFIPAIGDPFESLSHFVERRLGREFLDYAINPMVGGIYAGDPAQLSVKWGFPKVWNLEAEHGSLIRGAIAKMQARRREGSSFKTRLVAWDQGMEVLTQTLATKLQVATSVRLKHLTRTGYNCWSLSGENKKSDFSITCKQLVCAIPAYALSTLPFEASLSAALAPLNVMKYPPVSMLALGFRRDAIEHPLDGFGMLIPACEGFSILGTLFSSTLFPHRAPEGHVLLTTFIGGARQPEFASLDTDALKTTVLKDLKQLLGLRADPVFCAHVFWKHAIPQYTPNHASHLECLENVERDNPGLYFTGNYREGIALGKCLLAAKKVLL